MNFRSSDEYKCGNYDAGVPNNEEVHQLHVNNLSKDQHIDDVQMDAEFTSSFDPRLLTNMSEGAQTHANLVCPVCSCLCSANGSMSQLSSGENTVWSNHTRVLDLECNNETLWRAQ